MSIEGDDGGLTAGLAADASGVATIGCFALCCCYDRYSLTCKVRGSTVGTGGTASEGDS